MHHSLAYVPFHSDTKEIAEVRPKSAKSQKLGFYSIDKIISSQLMRDIAAVVFSLSVLRSSTTAGNNLF